MGVWCLGGVSLRNEELGRLGELSFESHCVEANLKPSKLYPDETGKDYIVEWKYEGTARSADLRKSYPLSYVQLKSTSVRDRIRFKLSTIEYLAKQEGPCFIICPIFSNNIIVEYRAIHLIGKELAYILERLRSCSAKGCALSKASGSFNINNASMISANGEALKEYFETSIDKYAPRYSSAKSTQLQTLGFDAESHRMKFVVDSSKEEFAKALVGIGSLKVRDAEFSETRFGIELPDAAFPKFQTGTVSIEPSMLAEGRLTVVDTTGRETTMKVNAVAPPMINIGIQIFRIISQYLEILVTISDDKEITKVDFKFFAEKGIRETCGDIRELHAIYHLVSCLQADIVSHILIESNNGAQLKFEGKRFVNNDLYIQNANYYFALCSSINDLFVSADVENWSVDLENIDVETWYRAGLLSKKGVLEEPIGFEVDDVTVDITMALKEDSFLIAVSVFDADRIFFCSARIDGDVTGGSNFLSVSGKVVTPVIVREIAGLADPVAEFEKLLQISRDITRLKISVVQGIAESDRNAGTAILTN